VGKIESGTPNGRDNCGAEGGGRRRIATDHIAGVPIHLPRRQLDRQIPAGDVRREAEDAWFRPRLKKEYTQ
jgi:hypothetical protein